VFLDKSVTNLKGEGLTLGYDWDKAVIINLTYTRIEIGPDPTQAYF